MPPKMLEVLDALLAPEPSMRLPVANAAARLGYSHMPIVSGAGHDAVYVARLAPTGMIFIPCKDGISHNEIEDAQPDHVIAGCIVLHQVMLQRAGVGSAVDAGGR